MSPWRPRGGAERPVMLGEARKTQELAAGAGRARICRGAGVFFPVVPKRSRRVRRAGMSTRTVAEADDPRLRSRPPPTRARNWGCVSDHPGVLLRAGSRWGLGWAEVALFRPRASHAILPRRAGPRTSARRGPGRGLGAAAPMQQREGWFRPVPQVHS